MPATAAAAAGERGGAVTVQDNAALAADVANLKEGHAALRGEVRDFKAEVTNGFASIRTSLDDGLARMSKALDTKTSTNWAPIGIVVGALGTVLATAVAALVAVGVAITGGLRDQAGQTNERIQRLSEESVKTQVELAYTKGRLNPLSPQGKQ